MGVIRATFSFLWRNWVYIAVAVALIATYRYGLGGVIAAILALTVRVWAGTRKTVPPEAGGGNSGSSKSGDGDSPSHPRRPGF